MRALGWKNKGHKNKWCIKRGYVGVSPYPGEYSKGGVLHSKTAGSREAIG